MKSKARRTLEKWAKGADKDPTFLAEGKVFLFPSHQTSRTEATHYLVTWMQRQTPKRVFEEFACSCRGFAFSPYDECRHIKELKAAILRAGGNLATG